MFKNILRYDKFIITLIYITVVVYSQINLLKTFKYLRRISPLPLHERSDYGGMLRNM
jgi:hypothetical protein